MHYKHEDFTSDVVIRSISIAKTGQEELWFVLISVNLFNEYIANNMNIMMLH